MVQAVVAALDDTARRLAKEATKEAMIRAKKSAKTNVPK